MKRYQSYKKSQIEWVSEIPTSWEETRLKYVGNLYGGLTGKSGEDFKQEGNPFNKPYIPYTNIFRNTYISKNHVDYVVLGDGENQNKVKKFDLFFLMSSETYQDLGKSCILIDDIEELYLNSFCKGFRVKNKNVNPLFLNYQLLGSVHKELISIEGRGFTRINLRQDRLNETPIILPPLLEQNQIVEFLDEKTKLIDRLISTKEQKISLLKEQRITLINQVVSKGLNPDSKMVESGFEWIGDLPKGWTIGKLKHNSELKISSVDKHIYDDEIQVKVCNYTDVYYNEFITNQLELRKGSCTIDEFHKYKLDKGDVIITKDSESPNDIGVPSIVMDDLDNIVCGYHLSIIKPIPHKISGEYLFRQLQTTRIRRYFEVNSNGITRFGLGKSSVLETPLIIPPINEQIEIVEYIDSKTKEIENMVQLEKRKIDLLKEYRQSLISEVVTGKVKVTQ